MQDTKTLKDILLHRIALTGPITVADYMAECLMNPVHGYYQQQRVFGKDGDFITAPEISQMFGEMIALWLIDRWQAMGSPKAFQLVEAGPGRGTLMADILRTVKTVPAFLDAVQVVFIEASQQLKTLQREKVPDARWITGITDLAALPTLFVANEFIDALPIHQYIVGEKGLEERRIGLHQRDLTWVRGPASSYAALITASAATAQQGSIFEVCPAGISFAADVAAHITAHGGAALIIDYGYEITQSGDSFQAVENHRYVDPLSSPGTADLTAHVDFARLIAAAENKGVTGYDAVTQGQFLMELGMGMRAQQLAAGLDAKGQADILDALKRLTAPDAMGTLFKCIALQDTNLSAPPGVRAINVNSVR